MKNFGLMKCGVSDPEPTTSLLDPKQMSELLIEGVILGGRVANTSILVGLATVISK